VLPAHQLQAEAGQPGHHSVHIFQRRAARDGQRVLELLDHQRLDRGEQAEDNQLLALVGAQHKLEPRVEPQLGQQMLALGRRAAHLGADAGDILEGDVVAREPVLHGPQAVVHLALIQLDPLADLIRRQRHVCGEQEVEHIALLCGQHHHTHRWVYRVHPGAAARQRDGVSRIRPAARGGGRWERALI
jgi:hypothetical protein